MVRGFVRLSSANLSQLAFAQKLPDLVNTVLQDHKLSLIESLCEFQGVHVSLVENLKMSFPWEIVTVVADSVIVSLFYAASKVAEKKAQRIQNAPFYKVGKELEAALEDAPDNVLPYVCISGKVEPCGRALNSHYHDQQGVIQHLIFTEHSAKRYEGFWIDCKEVIHDALNVTPFNMVADDDSQKSVQVCEPLTAECLMNELETTHDKFNPNQSSFVERGAARVFVSKGVQETEKMLPTETYITGFGQLELSRDGMQLMPPDADEGFKYIFSELSQRELIKSYQTHASLMKRCAVIISVPGVLILGFWVCKMCHNYLEC